LESYHSIVDFDVVGISLQSELNYINIPYLLDLAGITRRADERAEARWRIAHRRQVLGAGRVAGIVMLGLIALVVPIVGPQRHLVAGLLILVIAPMSYLIERYVPHPRTDSSHVALDLATAIGLAQIIPEAWFVAVVLGIASVSSSITSIPTGLFLALHATFLVGMSAVAIGHDIDGWVLPIVALAGTTVPIVMYGRWFRKNEESVSSRVGDLMESTVAIFWEADLHGVLTAAWGRVSELTGYTPEEWMERFPDQVVHPDDLDLVRLTPNEQHLKSVEHTLRVQHRDGQWLWIRHLIRFDRRGRASRLMGVSFDVTTLERTRASLREQALRDTLTS
ncbi:MAG: PAS domain-containing protein, partial [Acidimicrobiales bacterium]